MARGRDVDAGAHAAAPDEAAERRDVVRGRRDAQGQERDQAADARDQDGGRRDRAAVGRDVLAERRDRAADGRDAHALRRESDGRQRDHAAEAAAARRSAARDREEAADDRLAGARDRARAGWDRSTARSDRSSALADRGADRVLALADRAEAARDLAHAGGHAAGDGVLVRVVQALRAALRPYDLVVRYGGDEFICVLTNTRMEDAIGWRERLQSTLLLNRVTIGLAGLHDEDEVHTLLQRADADLYRQR